MKNLNFNRNELIDQISQKQSMNYKIQVKEILQLFMKEVKQALAQIIVSLESDEIIQQMRNDASLYDYKLNHIMQLINKQLTIDKKIEQIITDYAELRLKNNKLQEMMIQINHDYVDEISNIEIKFHEYIEEKQKQNNNINIIYEEKLQLQRTKYEEISKKKRQLELQNDQLIEKYSKSQQKLKFKDTQMNQKLKQNQNRFHQQINEIEIGISQQKQQHDEIVILMKQDMQTIRESWENKCLQLQKCHKQNHNFEMVKMEEQMDKKLNQYISQMNNGNNVIIKIDEQSMNRKIQIIKKQYQFQILKIEKKNQDKENIMSHLQQNYKDLEYENKQVINAKNSLESQLVQMKKQLQQKEARQKQLEQREKNYKKKQKSWIQKIAQIEEQLINKNKIIDKINKQQIQYEKQNKVIKMKYEKQAQQIEFLKNNINKYQKIQHENDKMVKNLQIKIQQLENTIKKKQKQVLQNQQKLLVLEKRCLSLNQLKSNTMKKCDRLYLIVHKCKKQLQLMIEHTKYLEEVYKLKISTEVLHLKEQLEKYKEGVISSNRTKITNLIDEVEINSLKYEEEINKLGLDKVNLQRQLKKNQNQINIKDKQYKQLLNQCERIQLLTLSLEDNIKKQKRTSQELISKLKTNQYNYDYSIDKIQQEIKHKIIEFSHKWITQINKLQSQIVVKNGKLAQLSEKVQLIWSDYENSNSKQDHLRQELKNYKKKFQCVKIQRDQKVNNLIKRLEVQTKSKLNLQNQLKNIRNQLTRTIPTINNMPNGNNFSFNQRENTPSNHNNYYHTISNNKSTMQNKRFQTNSQSNNYRQKQLSQIKDMIAKTSKMISPHISQFQPEKDYYK